MRNTNCRTFNVPSTNNCSASTNRPPPSFHLHHLCSRQKIENSHCYSTSEPHLGICDISFIQTFVSSSNSSFDSQFSCLLSGGAVTSTHEVGRFVLAAAPRSTFDGTYLTTNGHHRHATNDHKAMSEIT